MTGVVETPDSASVENRAVVLVSRPKGLPEERNFALRRSVVPPLCDGEFLIRNHYASIDPAMRGWLDDRPSYLPPVAIGAAMRAGTVGQVVQSRATGVSVGDWVKGINALEEYSVGRAGDGNRLIDPTRAKSMREYISVAGGASLTAYVGVRHILHPQPGETLLVSSAAGGVGSVAGQLAKLAGARVIGIAGGPEKCRYLLEVLGFDHAIDYRGKDERALRAEIASAAPVGLNMLFENVGGAGLDAALRSLASHARIALCGMISEYNTPAVGARNIKELIFRSATMRGFTLLDFPEQIVPATDQLFALAHQGKVRFSDHVEQGLENACSALRKLFVGGTHDKLILQIV